MLEIHEVIRRIEFLNVEVKNIADGKSDDDLNPWFRYLESPESPEFTLNFRRI